MKKIVFSLVAIAMVSFASATEIKTGEPVKEKVVTESTVEKHETAKETEGLKVVSCDATINGIYVSTTYSCFFCWGGADNGCKAALLDLMVELYN